MGKADVIERIGRGLLDLLASGRGADVTEDMLDLGDPVQNARLNEWLFNNYDLPMDAASRMARAASAGFGGDVYHGTASDFTRFSPVGGRGYDAFVTPSTQFANEFADSSGAYIRDAVDETFVENVMPLRAKGSLFDFGDRGAVSDLLSRAYSRQDQGTRDDMMLELLSGDWGAYESESIPPALRAMGFDGVNMVEDGAPTIGVLDARNIRSRFARFDPRLSHLRNLNAGLAGVGLSGLLAMSPEDAQAAEIEAYLSGVR
jgi:hypothetical protein